MISAPALAAQVHQPVHQFRDAGARLAIVGGVSALRQQACTLERKWQVRLCRGEDAAAALLVVGEVALQALQHLFSMHEVPYVLEVQQQPELEAWAGRDGDEGDGSFEVVAQPAVEGAGSVSAESGISSTARPASRARRRASGCISTPGSTPTMPVTRPAS